MNVKNLHNAILCVALLFSFQALPFKNAENNKKVQEIITGTVTSAADNLPVPGVTVMEKNTNNGVVTDFDGNYEIEVSGPDAILVFSYIGFETKEIPVNDQEAINNVVLEEDLGQLDEVVVVGYGTQKRSDVTGSVSSVPQERLENLPVTNVTQAIQGTTAGLNITEGSSVPGSTGSIQVRGVNSINANNSPFIVLDGSPFFGTLNDINTRDIKSIEVLKDASAVAIYGTRGSNGVILITTKEGKLGKPTINYTVYGGVEEIANIFEPRGPDAYVQKYADYMNAMGLEQNRILPNFREVENYEAGRTTDWIDEVTRTGVIQEHNLSINGGSENASYYLSGGFLDQKGVIQGYDYQKVTFRTNLDLDVTDYLKVGVNAFFANNNFNGGRANLLEAAAMSPYSVPYDDEGNMIIFPMEPEQLFANPLLPLNTDRMERDNNFSGNAFAELTPGFIEGLSYRFNASYAHNPYTYRFYSGRAANNTQGGTANLTNSEENNWVIENILSYTKSFGKHNLDFTALYSAQENEYFTSSSNSSGFINDALSYYNIGAGENIGGSSNSWKSTLLSQMGRINYNYDSKYLLTLTARRDGFSAFGADTDKYGIFPSMALGWNVHREDFLQDSDNINQLKLRFSYGETGNQAVGVGQTQTTASTTLYPFGGSAQVGTYLGGMGNTNLNWETTTSANFGIDFGFFENRLGGTIEAYRSRTRDILIQRSLPSITGSNSVWDNLGEMQNTGLEVTLNTVPIRNDNFRWEMDLNFSTFKNELLDIYGDGEDDLGNRWFIGKPLWAVYDYEMVGVWQEGEDPSNWDPSARPGDLKFADLNGDGVIDPENDRKYLGTGLPSWTGGLTNRLSYKNFDFSIFVQTIQGVLKNNSDIHFADEGGRRNTPIDVGYWTPENPSNEFASMGYRNPRGYGFPRDASFVRIKDARLSYRLPADIIENYGVSNFMIYVAGRNLYTFTDWIGWDPESNQDPRGSGNWTNNYPVVRTFSVGLNVSL
ncbi:TonB-linked outer membrane protein, SusC/RagA family [Salegentibacter salinarum]|uniref:SusC/RagA family TonB-linked outer membrane protein n=1 Tax=Salegentibacter salinarum TaxID=447422 RepID=UPI0009A7E51A|nr:TonB-dependent receptor [Salegentibacter salinarum]SKB51177.1 TonB-linked outer membrane protein, SusC/RagA family [Salegentibacter salinarum]